MERWLKRLGNAVVIGLAWALMWALVALLVGVTVIDPDNSMDEMWPAIGAYPGFLCALLFSAFIGIAERGRALAELSISRSAAWGAVSGMLVGALPFAIGESTSDRPWWVLGSAVLGSFTLMSVISAVATVMVARMATKRALRSA